MLGWDVSVYRQCRPRHSPAEAGAATGHRLAGWFTMSTGWLDALVTAGDAHVLGTGGYPDSYTAPASALAPVLLEGPPGADHDTPFRPRASYEVGEPLPSVTVDADAIRSLDPDEWLIVLAWDAS